MVWPQDAATQMVWVADVLHRLRQEGGEILDEVWHALPPPLSAAAQGEVVGERAYFAYHHALLDYPRYRAQRFPIGSGISESACKSVLKQRESSSSRSWTNSPSPSSTSLSPFLSDRPEGHVLRKQQPIARDLQDDEGSCGSGFPSKISRYKSSP